MALFELIDAGAGIDAISKILAGGADPNERRDGKTFLSWAVSHHKKYLVKHLLDHGANPDLADDPTADEYGVCKPPLAIASRRDADKEIVELLLNSHSDPNISDSVKMTPLMIAALHGALENCKLLVKAGADPLKTSEYGQDALFFAMTRDSPGVVSYLLDLGMNPNRSEAGSETALENAIRNNLVNSLSVLKSRGFYSIRNKK